jgi:hypothetical protein
MSGTMAKPALSTILKKCGSENSKELKIKALREHKDNISLMELFKFAFDPRIKFLLPQAKVDYKVTLLLDQDERLYREVFKLVNLCVLEENFTDLDGKGRKVITHGGPTKRDASSGEIVASMSQLQRERIFIQTLESIYPSDAEMLMNVKNKQIGIRGITENTVRLAFPGMIYGDIEFLSKNKMFIPDELREANDNE